MYFVPMIRALKTLFGLWAALLFALSLLIVTPCYLFVFLLAPKQKAPHIAHRYISRNWAGMLFPIFFVRVKTKNKELIDSKRVYVFIANHRSQLDVPAYAVACPNTIRFLAKEELTKIPLLGYIIRNLYISVNRKSSEDRQRSMNAMQQSLRDGISIFLCPEGTRNKTSEPLLPFKDGAFRTAIEAQVPLAVLTVKNSEKLLSPLRPVELSPGTVECIWSMPIETKGMTEQDIPRLKEIARQQMLNSLNNS
jgi:1-acyl-sn-glycerol-3-phosphate acyltransferase